MSVTGIILAIASLFDGHHSHAHQSCPLQAELCCFFLLMRATGLVEIANIAGLMIIIYVQTDADARCMWGMCLIARALILINNVE